jgi:hypothetical protein
MGIYIKFLQYGESYTNKDGLRAATLVGYAKAISILFTLRGFRSPVDPPDPNNAGGNTIMNHKREEDIAVQRYPLNSAILAKLGTMALSSCSMDSEQNLIFDITCLGRFIGPCVSKYAQTSSHKVDYHINPSGNKVIKAFTADGYAFFDEAGNTLKLCNYPCLDQAHKVKITWRIQKNHQNGQAITISAKKICHKICPIRAAGRMVLHARRLGQPDSMPMACYSHKNKRAHLLTGKHIAILF